MNLIRPKNETECFRCGFYAAEIIYVIDLDTEYLFCNCGVFKVEKESSIDLTSTTESEDHYIRHHRYKRYLQNQPKAGIYTDSDYFVCDICGKKSSMRAGETTGHIKKCGTCARSKFL